MKSADVLNTILIVAIVFILVGLNVIYVLKKDIEKNWVKYRCSPLIIPFAGFFGKNTMENFTYCVQNIQNSYMGFALQPTNFSIDVFNNLGGEFANSIKYIIDFISLLRNLIGDVTGNIMGVFMNISVEFMRLIVGIKDLLGKMTGILVTGIYMVEGSIMAGNSAWSGPPGKLLRELCFHKNTLIQLKNGTFKKIIDIKLGDELKDGANVYGTVHLQNWKKNESEGEYFYKLPNGENKGYILVTGSHFILLNGKYDYVKNHPLAKPTIIKDKYLYCLITSNHNIKIGEYTFWDWEDTPEMHKNLK